MRKIIKFVLNKVPRKYIQRVVHIVLPIVGLAYTGRGVKCPVCGSHYRKFMPYGYGEPRENALCPRCLALERHRLLWVWLLRETDFFTARPRLLHIAPEWCFLKRFEHLLEDNYVTADLESPLAKVKMDVQKIPFFDNEFDVVICNHILEHVDDDALAMREIRRVLKPGGWGVLLSPVNFERETTYEDPSLTTPDQRRAAYGQYDHKRDYGRDYPERLEKAGFRVESIDYIPRLAPGEARIFALRPQDIIYKVYKD